MTQGPHSIYIPKWVCTAAISVSTVALIVQAVIDVDQGTTGMVLFSRQWFSQAWQMGLITLFIIISVAFAGTFLGAGAWARAAALYVVVVALMTVTVINGADFIADNSLAERVAQNAKQVQAQDIVEIKNKLLIEERKEATDSAWRTYLAAKTTIERERILGQIQSLTRDTPTLVAPEIKAIKAGSGSIWNRWLGWRPESIQEVKAIAVPVLIMLCKTIGLTLGFAYWPAPGSLPETVRRAQSKAYLGAVSRLTFDEARSDIVNLSATGALNGMEATGADFARRWSVRRPTAAEWIRHLSKENLITLQRAKKGNRLFVRAAAASSKSSLVHVNVNGAAAHAT